MARQKSKFIVWIEVEEETPDGDYTKRDVIFGRTGTFSTLEEASKLAGDLHSLGAAGIDTVDDLLASCRELLEQQERDYESDDNGIPESGMRARTLLERLATND
jgi:hypothetical protein